MSNKLDRVKDWNVVFKECGFQLNGIALKYELSTRTVQRHLRKYFGESPKQCLDRLRAEAAGHELARGESVKRTSIDHGFKQASHFTKFFYRVRGSTPRNYSGE